MMLNAVCNNVMQWGYGISWGAALSAAIVARPTPAMIAGPLFGGTVRGSSYVILPLARLYKPPLGPMPPPTHMPDWLP